MASRTLSTADFEAARVFAEAVVSCGKTHEQLGEDIGVTAGMIHQWSKPLRAISAKRAPAAALAVGIDDPSCISVAYAQLMEFAQDARRIKATAPPGSAPPSPISPPEIAPAYVRVEQMGEADMGDGRVNDDYPEVIRSVDFELPYIRALMGFVPPPGRLKLVTGRNDSMMPTIMPGDVVLVDTGITWFDGDGLYLVNSGNGQQIKRLHDKGGVIHVVSDNTFYTPEPVNERTIIGGKVYLRNRLDRMA
jgi:phage repressor protein C with HTH and peptisase S24 domain